jgi:transposase InsO family protein
MRFKKMVSPALRRELVDSAKNGFQLTEPPGMQSRVGRTIDDPLRERERARCAIARKRPRRRKAAMGRPVGPTTVAANQRWAMDFMHGVLASGPKICVFTVVDLHTRECLTLRAQRSFRGEDVASILCEIGEARAALPVVIQVDSGTEFTSTAVDRWAYWNRVQLDFSRPPRNQWIIASWKPSTGACDVSA